MGSLLELGAGFHPDLTGRENVFLNGSIYGLKRAYLREQLDEIVAFAGLEHAIDRPVRTYSSGMYMRLGLTDESGERVYHWLDDALEFIVYPAGDERGVVRLDGEWSGEEIEAQAERVGT